MPAGIVQSPMGVFMLRHLTVAVTFLILFAAPVAAAGDDVITEEPVMTTIATLVEAHGEESRPLAWTGVHQVAAYWRVDDGDVAAFTSFCQTNFVPAKAGREALLKRFDRNFEALWGHRGALRRFLREPTELDLGDPLAVDSLFSTLDPFDHLLDDLFSSKVAFVILLNFGQLSLDHLNQYGASMSRQAWAEARLAKSVSL